MAGYIVEHVSGMKFDEYVHKNIFKPLGMEHTAIRTDLSDNEWVSSQRTKLQCYTAEGELIPDCVYYLSLYPAGACVSNLEDFETFAKALLSPKSPLFESENTLKEFLTPTHYYGDSKIPSNCHGLWVMPFAKKAIGHGGNTQGCSAMLLIEPEEQVGAVVMTNQSEEGIYNKGMMNLIFGAFDAEQYFGRERILPTGIYRSARTILKGPLKYNTIGYITEWAPDRFWVYMQGKGQVCGPYTDFIKIPTAQYVIECLMVQLWKIVWVFSLLSIGVKILREIVKHMRHKKMNIILEKWSLAVCILQCLTYGLLKLAMFRVDQEQPSISYVWVFAVIAVITIIMVIMSLYGMVKIINVGSMKKRKLYNSLNLILLIGTISNILYWNLYMFWAV